VRSRVDPSLDSAKYDFRHRVRVRFADTDAMGVVHHASYLPYLEETRVEYLRAIGLPYRDVRRDGIEFAVLEVAVRYVQPLRFDDEVDVHLALATATRATFQLAYLLTVDTRACATAVTVHGCIDATGRPIRMPSWLRALVPAPVI
jgi:acyl-CoA thioester hydrolase